MENIQHMFKGRQIKSKVKFANFRKKRKERFLYQSDNLKLCIPSFADNEFEVRFLTYWLHEDHR